MQSPTGKLLMLSPCFGTGQVTVTDDLTHGARRSLGVPLQKPLPGKRDGRVGGHDLAINTPLTFSDPSMHLTIDILRGTI